MYTHQVHREHYVINKRTYIISKIAISFLFLINAELSLRKIIMHL